MPSVEMNNISYFIYTNSYGSSNIIGGMLMLSCGLHGIACGIRGVTKYLREMSKKDD